MGLGARPLVLCRRAAAGAYCPSGLTSWLCQWRWP
jgi:hypothetical protein